MTQPVHHKPKYADTRTSSGIQVSGSDMSTRRNQAIQRRREKERKKLSPLAIVAIVAAVVFVALVVASLLYFKPWKSAPVAPVSPAPSAPAAPDDAADTPGARPVVGVIDWNNLARDEKGRLYYTSKGAVASRIGIDTSEWDTDTDWAQVAADGIQFVFVRVGYRGESEGGLYEDKGFRYNYEGCLENGIPMGLYFYSTAMNAMEAREEADFVLDLLASVGGKLDLPIVWDHESYNHGEARCYGMTEQDYTEAAQAFCNRIEHAGYDTMIYGNRGAISRLSTAVRERYSIWLAEWDVNAPTVSYDIVFWQHDSEGAVAGMWRHVDHNLWLTEVPIKNPAYRDAEYRAAVAAGEIIRTDVDELAGSITDKPLLPGMM